MTAGASHRRAEPSVSDDGMSSNARPRCRERARTLVRATDDVVTEHVAGDAGDTERGGRLWSCFSRVGFRCMAAATEREWLDGECALIHGIGVRLSVERITPLAGDLGVATLTRRVQRVGFFRSPAAGRGTWKLGGQRYDGRRAPGFLPLGR